MSIKVEVITPEKRTLSDDVDFIAAPATDGEVGILPGHAPLLSSLGYGEIRLKKGDKTNYLAVTGGFLEVKDKSQVRIFAETAEFAEEIDAERAKQAADRAKTRLEKVSNLTDEEMTQLEADARRAMLRLKVAGLRQKRTHKPPGLH